MLVIIEAHYRCTTRILVLARLLIHLKFSVAPRNWPTAAYGQPPAPKAWGAIALGPVTDAARPSAIALGPSPRDSEPTS